MDLQIGTAVDVLRRTPETLLSLLGGLGNEWTGANEGPETFSPFDVVGHLIDGEETDWMVRARTIFANGPDLRFAPYDRFRHKDRNRGRTLGMLLEEFAQLRAANLAELGSWKLGPEELDLIGEHPTFGRVTLRQLLSAWVVHDLGHLAQVARVMAKQYSEAAGPFKEFLPVLTDLGGRTP